MNKRLFLIGVYFSLTPVVVFLLIFYTLFYTHSHTRVASVSVMNYNNFNALPEVTTQASTIDLGTKDARVGALETFFKSNGSPLLPYAGLIVTTADKYELDYRLLPAIAMQESNLCKKIPKKSTYNCWGFGIYGKKRTGFDSYEDAIRIVSKTLANEYVGKGLEDPYAIMSKYTPGSNGSWANSVTYFMEHIDASL
jgi:hypothetical protein